ncbi:PREDICTED: uncharacterized protein LOC106810893 [Priapulus caudatus]|uniref:Uncharacterized protein LOC106810893 n=1 Tax=Priapulus caudatus TaxID=37621 RepID=A0ABM1ECD0_PRICU|nr:PREDICTED: uncharacterized protein LOC106810893 [Priapulus caudatus]
MNTVLQDIAESVQRLSRDVAVTPRDRLDGVLLRLQRLQHILRQVSALTDDVIVLQQCNAAAIVMQQAEPLTVEEEHSTGSIVESYQRCGTVGRPAFEISREQLEFLLGYDFTVTDIARILGNCMFSFRKKLRINTMF